MTSGDLPLPARLEWLIYGACCPARPSALSRDGYLRGISSCPDGRPHWPEPRDTASVGWPAAAAATVRGSDPVEPLQPLAISETRPRDRDPLGIQVLRRPKYARPVTPLPTPSQRQAPLSFTPDTRRQRPPLPRVHGNSPSSSSLPQVHGGSDRSAGNQHGAVMPLMPRLIGVVGRVE